MPNYTILGLQQESPVHVRLRCLQIAGLRAHFANCRLLKESSIVWHASECEREEVASHDQIRKFFSYSAPAHQLSKRLPIRRKVRIESPNDARIFIETILRRAESFLEHHLSDVCMPGTIDNVMRTHVILSKHYKLKWLEQPRFEFVKWNTMDARDQSCPSRDIEAMQHANSEIQ
jgi:hypothetical protein